MQEFQKRIVKERDELAKKVEALNVFIDDDGRTYMDLPLIDKFLLSKQRDEMNCYLETLEYRIMRFTGVH